MKTILRITFLSLLFFALGCSKDDNEVPAAVKSDAKALTSLVFNAGDNEALSENVTASITEANKGITIAIPNGTDLSALIPTIQVSAKASVSPTGAQNFSNPLTYTVTAEDGSTATYTISIFILVTPNSSPLDFELIAPTDSGPNAFISVLPILSWNASTDPDGDTVTYDLYLNVGTTADQLYAENLTDTSFEVSERLALLQEYAWRVVAKDPKGATTSSTTSDFSTRGLRFNEESVTDNANFDTRASHTSVVFDNKLWVIGGSRKNDVWYSEDGITWSLATDTAPFSKRSGHTSVVFANKLWVIGGIDKNNIRKNDVWFSEDGISWSQATSAAPFSARYLHTSVVFDNKFWVIGGFDGERKNDVWFSTDGVNWSAATNAASFTGRQDHTSVVFDNKLWVIGGFDNRRKNDVWSSIDGVNWSKATNESTSIGRENHTSIVFDNKLWVIGGINEILEYKNDVWFSEDGVSWSEATSSAPFSVRSSHTSVVFDNKVWVIGGTDGDIKNDVWSFD